MVTLSIDLETSISTNRILCAAVVVDRDGARGEHTFHGDEIEDILKPICRLVREQDPDVITGYNIDNFDLPRILERTEHLVGKEERRNFWLGSSPINENSRRTIPIVAKTEHGVLREEFQWMHGGKPDRH